MWYGEYHAVQCICIFAFAKPQIAKWGKRKKTRQRSTQKKTNKQWNYKDDTAPNRQCCTMVRMNKIAFFVSAIMFMEVVSFCRWYRLHLLRWQFSHFYLYFGLLLLLLFPAPITVPCAPSIVQSPRWEKERRKPPSHRQWVNMG